MAFLIYSERAVEDLRRLTDFLLESTPASAARTADIITEAILILRNHPLVGRPVDDDLRELVISRGKTGYIALYSFEAEHDAVLILALRHQREAGYSEE